MSAQVRPDLARPHFLMCRPEHFGVVYSINPWMNPTGWARDQQALVAASQREWARLRRTLLDLGAVVELVPSAAGLPDLVFTANSAVVLDRTALLARFRHPERQPEEVYFEAAFRRIGDQAATSNRTPHPRCAETKAAERREYGSRAPRAWHAGGRRTPASPDWRQDRPRWLRGGSRPSPRSQCGPAARRALRWRRGRRP